MIRESAAISVLILDPFIPSISLPHGIRHRAREARIVTGRIGSNRSFRCDDGDNAQEAIPFFLRYSRIHDSRRDVAAAALPVFIMQRPDFEALFDASPYPYLLISAADLTIIGANSAYLRAVGRSAESLIGRHIFDAFPPNPSDEESTNIEVVRASIERAIATRLPDNTPFIRYAVPCADGNFEERFWSAVHTPVLDRNGEVMFVSQNAIDVTALYTFNRTSQLASLSDNLKSGADSGDFNQAPMHEALTRILNDERSHLRTLFDQAPGFIAAFKGKNHVFEIVNEAYYQLVGHRELIGKPAWEALPEVAGQGFDALLDTVMETGEPYVGRGLKVSLQREPDAPVAERYVDVRCHPVRDSDGSVSGIFVQGIDVTEMYTAQSLLAEKIDQLEKARAQQSFRLLLADLLRHASDAPDIFRKSGELIGRHLGVSRVLFGEYDRENMQVNYHSNYTDGTVVELNGIYPVSSFGSRNFASLEDGTTWISDDMEHDPRTAGPEMWPTFQSLAIYSGIVVPLSRYGTVISFLFINASCPRKWSDEEVELITDAAERIWTAVERMRGEDALREADRRKDQFLAMLAHELRNPIAPISAAAEFLQKAPDDPERVISASCIISRQAKHMTAIVNDLLDVSRVTSGLVVLEKTEVDLKRVVADAVEQVRPQLEAHRHRFSMRITTDATMCTGDFKRLVQVVANLLNNAAKYTPEGGQILVLLDTTDEQLVLRVADDGIGISKELLPNIFKPFSQGEREADRSQGGLGLGLALVKGLVERHGGSVVADSRGRDTGSTFTVRLPRRTTPAEAKRPQVDAGSADRKDARQLRLMVVDDNVDAAQTLAVLLETIGHHRVVIEHDPYKALERAGKEVFDAYLLDIGLPGIDGNELAQRLRALETAKNALLIAISGYTRQSNRSGSSQADFDHYFVKPVDYPKLLSLLSTIEKVAS